jgi:glycosyltransferase involved in cell wall biosynthesis
LFDAIEGVARANRKLAGRKSPVSIQLVVAGNFVDDDEKEEFDRILEAPETRGQVRYLGFVSNGVKQSALLHADFFCFPTYYQNENQPVNLIEAMAFGLPILTTRWRSLPELLPAGYRYLVDIRSPEQIGEALLASVIDANDESFRELFLRHFTIDQHLAALAAAFHSVKPADDPAPAAAVAHRGATKLSSTR